MILTTTEIMKLSPYSLATDGSTDMENIKMYFIVVRSFDPSLGRVTVMLPKICESRESTGRTIFELLDSELKKRVIPWSNCVSFAADNAAVMQGLGEGVAAFLMAQSPHISLVGCACHLIHLAVERASRQLRVNIQDFLVTIIIIWTKAARGSQVCMTYRSFVMQMWGKCSKCPPQDGYLRGSVWTTECNSGTISLFSLRIRWRQAKKRHYPHLPPSCSRLNLVLLISLKQHSPLPACLQCSPRSPPLSHQNCPHLHLVLQRSL